VNTIEVDGEEAAEQHGPNGVLIAVKRIGYTEPWLEILVHDGVATIKTDKARIEIER